MVLLLEVVEDSEEVVVEAEEKEEVPVRAVVSASVLVVVLGAAVEVNHSEAPSLPVSHCKVVPIATIMFFQLNKCLPNKMELMLFHVLALVHKT